MQSTVAFVMTGTSSQVLIKPPLQSCTLLIASPIEPFLQCSSAITTVSLPSPDNTFGKVSKLWILLSFCPVLKAPGHNKALNCPVTDQSDDSINPLQMDYCGLELRGRKGLFNCTFNLWLCWRAAGEGQHWHCTTTRCLNAADTFLHRQLFAECLHISFLSLVFKSEAAVYCHNQIELNEAPNQL